MKFTLGFFNNSVLQRGRDNCCRQPFEGTCNSNGVVYLEVRKNGKGLKDFRKIRVGTATKGILKGNVSGVPVGGPYYFSFSIEGGESVIVENVMVGDLWILGGQSNMEGCGRLDKRIRAIDQVRAYYMDNRWNLAEDPIHTLWKAAAPVHCGNPTAKNPHPYTGTGPGVSFGQEMFRNTGIPQGLLCCGHGGTTMAQWDPSLKKLGDKSLYGATVNRLKRLGGKVAGVIWYQGCSDAYKATAPLYTRNMIRFVKALRKDADDSNLPFVIVQIARVCNSTLDVDAWNSIRSQQVKLPEKIKNLLTVPAIDLSLDDSIHISGEAQQLLGRRLADAMLCFSDKKRMKPIVPGKITVSSDPCRPDFTVIKIPFKNVCGSLVSGSRPAGFTSIDRSGAATADVFKVTLDGANAFVKMGQLSNSFSSIWYGYGLDPYCNITDEAGRGVPAFEAIINKRALKPAMPLISEFLVSDPFYTAESFKNMEYPSGDEKLNFRKAFFSGFYIAHPDREKLATPENKIFFFKCRLNCQADVKLRFLFGYDGPVRVFLDSMQVYKDMKGTNPIIKDHHAFRAVLNKGEHELMIVLASNEGRMWGLSLRAERMDGGDVFPEVIPVCNVK